MGKCVRQSFERRTPYSDNRRRLLVTRASSACKRLISIGSAVRPVLPLTCFNLPSRFAVTQFDSVCLITERVRAASAMLWPDSTGRTASCLNSSVYMPHLPFLIHVSTFCNYNSSLRDKFCSGKVTDEERGHTHA
jgi:hypothetical protein